MKIFVVPLFDDIWRASSEEGSEESPCRSAGPYRCEGRRRGRKDLLNGEYSSYGLVQFSKISKIRQHYILSGVYIIHFDHPPPPHTAHHSFSPTLREGRSGVDARGGGSCPPLPAKMFEFLTIKDARVYKPLLSPFSPFSFSLLSFFLHCHLMVLICFLFTGR